MDRGHLSNPTVIPRCTLVPSWGWEGRAWQAQDSGRAVRKSRGREHVHTQAHHLQDKGGLVLQLAKVLKRGDPPWGEKQQIPGLLFLVPGKH